MSSVAPQTRRSPWSRSPTAWCTPCRVVAANHFASTGPPKLQSSFLDGTSNTVALAERYFQAKAPPHPVQFSGALSGSAAYVPGFDPAKRVGLFGYRPAVFADAGWLDVVPVTSGFPPVARPSVPGTLFQVRPTTDQADGHQLQTPYASGLLVALFDGSVRTIHPERVRGRVLGGGHPGRRRESPTSTDLPVISRRPGKL